MTDISDKALPPSPDTDPQADAWHSRVKEILFVIGAPQTLSPDEASEAVRSHFAKIDCRLYDTDRKLARAVEALKEMRDLSFGVSGMSGTEINRWFNDRARTALSDLTTAPAEAERETGIKPIVEALADILALPIAVKELDYLDKGIGTATPNAAWLRARAALRKSAGA